VRAEKKPGTVTVTCEDKSPQRARDLATFFGEYGNQVFRRISHSSAREERAFLETRVAQARRDMDEAALRLREFQEQNKVIDLTEQGRAVVSAMASIRAELLSKQMQLSFQDGYSAREEGTSDQLRRQVTILESKLHSLEEDTHRLMPQSAPAGHQPAAPAPRKKGRAAATDDGARVFPAAMDMPKLRYELERRFREQKIQETLFVLLTQRYETARVNEARDTSTFQILDIPTIPTKKARPKRIMVATTGLMLGLVAGLAWVVGPPWLRLRFGRRPENPVATAAASAPDDHEPS
jgi:capsule polysaccharide export protein KpsE/RkpR